LRRKRRHDNEISAVSGVTIYGAMQHGYRQDRPMQPRLARHRLLRMLRNRGHFGRPLHRRAGSAIMRKIPMLRKRSR